MADLFDVTLEERQSISRIIGIDSIYINIKNLVLMLLPNGIQSLGYMAKKTAGFFSPTAVIIGLMSSPISYSVTKAVLLKILCQMEFDSFRMIDFLEKKIKIGESDFSYVILKTETEPEEPDSIICQHEICRKSSKKV